MITEGYAREIQKDQIGPLELPEELQRFDRVVKASEGRLGIAGDWINLLTTNQRGDRKARFEECHGECAFENCGGYGTHIHLYLQGMAQPVTRPIFSKDAAHECVTAMENDGFLSKEEAPQIHARLSRQENLGTNRTRADRVVAGGTGTNTEAIAYLLDRLFDCVPEGEERGREAHFDRCNGTCGHTKCAEYPAHALFYLDFVTEPDGTVYFSESIAKKRLGDTIEQGFVAEEARGQLTYQLESCGLQTNETRADRILRIRDMTDSARLFEIIFGLTPPHRRELPRLEEIDHKNSLGEWLDDRCAVAYAFGNPLPHVIFSRKGLTEVIKAAMELGILAETDIARLEAQLEALNLPPTHALDDRKPQGSSSLSVTMTIS